MYCCHRAARQIRQIHLLQRPASSEHTTCCMCLRFAAGYAYPSLIWTLVFINPDACQVEAFQTDAWIYSLQLGKSAKSTRSSTRPFAWSNVPPACNRICLSFSNLDLGPCHPDAWNYSLQLGKHTRNVDIAPAILRCRLVRFRALQRRELRRNWPMTRKPVELPCWISHASLIQGFRSALCAGFVKEKGPEATRTYPSLIALPTATPPVPRQLRSLVVSNGKRWRLPQIHKTVRLAKGRPISTSSIWVVIRRSLKGSSSQPTPRL